MSGFANSSRRIRIDDLKVAASTERPDWITAADRLPDPGEQVYCAEGMAEVTKVLGKTSDGSRLLELTLPDRPRHPFFASSTNVLVAPR
jgi:hypothetical protein